MKQLFEYVVLFHEYDEDNEYKDSKIIIEKTTILAKSERDVVFKVTRLIPEEFTENPDHVQILIRNF